MAPKEPATAPHPEQWYPLVLGSSLTDSSKRYYSLRYEFKPASIDTSRPGTLHKSADNKVTVEFCNNQPGKPNVAFQGLNEECKDSDAVLFFDGKTLKVERLHRAVKTLRHLRLPGESSASNLASNADTRSSPVNLNGHEDNNNTAYRPPRAENVEEIVIGSQHEPAAGTAKKAPKSAKVTKCKTPTPSSSPLKRSSPSIFDIVDDDAVVEPAKKPRIEMEHIDVVDDDVGDGHESDYVLEDVDVSDDEDKQQQQQPMQQQMQHQQPQADKQQQSSSSSGASTSSGSSDSSSGSEASDDDSG